jgi:hypothetical protein
MFTGHGGRQDSRPEQVSASCFLALVAGPGARCTGHQAGRGGGRGVPQVGPERKKSPEAADSSCARSERANTGYGHQEGMAVGRPGPKTSPCRWAKKILSPPPTPGLGEGAGPVKNGPAAREPLSPWGWAASSGSDSPTNRRGPRAGSKGPSERTRTRPTGGSTGKRRTLRHPGALLINGEEE